MVVFSTFSPPSLYSLFPPSLTCCILVVVRRCLAASGSGTGINRNKQELTGLNVRMLVWSSLLERRAVISGERGFDTYCETSCAKHCSTKKTKELHSYWLLFSVSISTTYLPVLYHKLNAWYYISVPCRFTHLLQYRARMVWHNVVCLLLCNSLGYLCSFNFGKCHYEYQLCCFASPLPLHGYLPLLDGSQAQIYGSRLK